MSLNHHNHVYECHKLNVAEHSETKPLSRRNLRQYNHTDIRLNNRKRLIYDCIRKFYSPEEIRVIKELL